MFFINYTYLISVDKMEKIHLFAVMILVFSISLFAFIIYNYNINFLQEQIKTKQKIEEIKEGQSELDEEFYEEQRKRDESIKKEQEDLQKKDEDGDGLTYAEELRLGTSDNSIDSDGDSIPDSEDAHPAGGGENYKITINWEHNGLPYKTQFGIHEDKYLYYKNQKRSYCCDDWDKYATPNDPTIQTIAKDIVDVSISTGDPRKYDIAIDFVESMIYEKDIDYISKNEWPKYPIETIIDEKGDCEDTSFLMASILEALNIDTVLLIYEDHVAVGVWCENCTGGYYNYNNKNYFYLETTGMSGLWKIGWIPEKYKNKSTRIIDVS